MTTTHTTRTTDQQPDASSKPTPRQLRYLRELATQRGESFTMPRTKAQASAEIQRLKARQPTPNADVRREQRQVSNDMAPRRDDATRVRRDEVTGYGSSATWNTETPTASDSADSPAPPRTPGDRGVTNPPVELGRYTTSHDGERIVRGQRIHGVVRLTDIPASLSGRRYLIERGLRSNAELQAIVADYLGQAQAHDAIPANHGTLRKA